MTDLETTKRLYKDYTKKFEINFICSFLFCICCWKYIGDSLLVDPAIEKIFINKDCT